jgi:hypothetical protein
MSMETVGAKLGDEEMEKLEEFQEKNDVNRSEAVRSAVRDLDSKEQFRNDSVLFISGVVALGLSAFSLVPNFAVTAWTILALVYLLTVRLSMDSILPDRLRNV